MFEYSKSEVEPALEDEGAAELPTEIDEVMASFFSAVFVGLAALVVDEGKISSFNF